MDKHTPELTRYRCAQYPPCDGWVVKYGTLCPACARLIAAAPNLLSALTELLDQLQVIGIPDWHGAEGLDLQQARAAIAKATGTEST